MNWTKELNAQLEHLFDLGWDDKRIKAELGVIGQYAVAKQRSNLGLVKVTKQKGLHRAAKTIVPAMSTDFLCIFYKGADGMNHFSMVDDGLKSTANTVAQNLIQRQGIKEVILLAPTSKLVMQGITEVKI